MLVSCNAASPAMMVQNNSRRICIGIPPEEQSLALGQQAKLHTKSGTTMNLSPKGAAFIRGHEGLLPDAIWILAYGLGRLAGAAEPAPVSGCRNLQSGAAIRMTRRPSGPSRK
jgi:hypothetical protein